MGQYVLLLVVALTVGAVVFGVTVLLSGSDPGLEVAEPDGRAVPLPGTRPLVESDITGIRFDTALRGYRMAQVDQALRRAAYDIGYKDELISVLEAEVTALRDGRTADADVLRQAREAALIPAAGAPAAAPAAEAMAVETPAEAMAAETPEGTPAEDADADAGPEPVVTVSRAEPGPDAVVAASEAAKPESDAVVTAPEPDAAETDPAAVAVPAVAADKESARSESVEKAKADRR